ncbi:MAG: ubiquinol-cytochrome C chaperone family protein [Azospirillaceae bacterium]
MTAPVSLFSRLRRGTDPARTAAPELYTALVERARAPDFYRTLGVPDTVDGRFDLIVLHAHLLFRRLRGGGEAAERLSQAVFDYMMSDMDRNLREMGVGDLGVGKRIKAMARAYYGRARAYDAALDDPAPGALAGALARNLLPADAPADAPAAAGLADYVRRSIRVLADCPTEGLLAGEVAFAEPVAAPEPA